MLKISLNKVKKYYGDRLLFECDDLKIYGGEKIAVVGVNGTGKTTLLDIMAKVAYPDEGAVDICGKISYMRQLGNEDFIEDEIYMAGKNINNGIKKDYGFYDDLIYSRIAGEFGAVIKYESYYSGGEKSKCKLVKALENACDILILDEPASNLDIEAIKLLEKKTYCF